MKLRTRILIDAQELIADKRRWGQGSMESAPPREAEQNKSEGIGTEKNGDFPAGRRNYANPTSAYDSLKRRLYTFERRLNE